MLYALTFTAKPGHEERFEELLSDEETTRRITKMLGARRNALFYKDGRMIRVLDLPEGAEKPSMYDLAQKHPWFHDLLAEVGELAEDGFDVDDEASLDAFDERVFHPLVLDVRA